LWRTMAEPKQTTTVRHYYSVRYPADRKLALTEEET